MIYLVFLIAAALPVVLAFVFLELNSEKQAKAEGLERINDAQRKLAKFLGWVIFIALVVLFTSLALDGGRHREVIGLLRFIFDGIKFLLSVSR